MIAPGSLFRTHVRRLALGGQRRGVALVLVLWLVVILGVIGATVMSGARTSTAVATNARALVVGRAAAESGIEATVAIIEDSLAALSDSSERRRFLNHLPDRVDDSVALGDGRFAVAISDPGRQLDVNAAPANRLALLLARFTDVSTAGAMARRIRDYIEHRAPSRDVASSDPRVPNDTRRTAQRLRSLDELSEIEGLDERVMQLAAPYLTVDGDGTINGETASDTVMAAAFGEVRDAPSQLVIVSRGWQRGAPSTHEIQGVYAISNDRLVLVSWRERAR